MINLNDVSGAAGYLLTLGELIKKEFSGVLVGCEMGIAYGWRHGTS